jgi:pilus assembly protein CpaF
MIEIQLSIPGQPPLTRRVDFGQHTIGRGLSADIRLKHDSVSRRHAQLSITETDTSIRDLGGDTALRRKGAGMISQAVVHPGDVFQIGDCELTFLARETAPVDMPTTHRSTTSSAGSAAEADITKTLPICALPSPGGGSPLDPPSTISAPTESVLTEELRPLQVKLQELVLLELDLFRRTAMNTMSSADLRGEARTAIERLISSGTVALPRHVDHKRFVQEMTAEIMGYGPIEPFLADESVSEVMVNGPNQIYVERRGKLTSVPASFINSESLMRVIERIVSPLGRRIDEGVPMVDARLPDGSRVNAIIPPLSLVGPILTIRKFSKLRFTMDRLVEMSSLTREMAEFLQLCVQYRKNIIVSGGTGSGKTTFLNALSASIPTSERIVTIEDAAELRLAQPHVLSLEARPANVEGRGEITIRELVRNALRMRPDRIIVGECRGGEALDMLQAMNTGHDGSLTTGHANSPRDLLSRLEVMVLMAGMELPVRAIREQISSAVDIVVQQTRFADGRRRVTSIVEVDGMEGEVILTQPLFAFKQRGVGADGEIMGEYVGFGQAPRFYEDLAEAGIVLDRCIFAASKATRPIGN